VLNQGNAVVWLVSKCYEDSAQAKHKGDPFSEPNSLVQRAFIPSYWASAPADWSGRGITNPATDLSTGTPYRLGFGGNIDSPYEFQGNRQRSGFACWLPCRFGNITFVAMEFADNRPLA
jgi:hypothetical protein